MGGPNKGLSKTLLAEKMGVPKSDITGLENGAENVPAETIEKLAHALDENVDTVLSAFQQQREAVKNQ